ncbi:MAG: histidine kinase dimerization/phospho-acceptor domain-containing protein [Gemmataceae bacterium]
MAGVTVLGGLTGWGLLARTRVSDSSEQREALWREQRFCWGQLFAAATHDLRNPLTSIKLVVQTLNEQAIQRGEPDADLPLVVADIDRMADYLETLRSLAHPLPTETARCDMTALVRNLCSLLELHAQRRGVRWECSTPDTVVVAAAHAGIVQDLVLPFVWSALGLASEGGKVSLTLHPPTSGQVQLELRLHKDGFILEQAWGRSAAPSKADALQAAHQSLTTMGGRLQLRDNDLRLYLPLATVDS